VERLPWAAHGSRFTYDFEELVAYLAQTTDMTSVKRLMGVSWESVSRIVERVVDERLDPSRFEGLTRIGVDEFSYRKRHRYLTTVVDHSQRRVVWAAKGKSSETLGEFFELLGPEGREQIECVTIDMSQAYKKAIKEHLPAAQIVYDRFHVQKLASTALDEVRRGILHDIRGTDAGTEVFRSRFILLRNPCNLVYDERRKLRDIERQNAPLYRAYLLKETLRRALNYKQPKRAREALKKWIAWAVRSRLQPFVKAGRTIREHLEGVMAYIGERLTNGVVEGINTRLRMIARRAFGFHSADALIGMAYLCCGKIELNPPLPGR